jgi:hypothetical protein
MKRHNRFFSFPEKIQLEKALVGIFVFPTELSLPSDDWVDKVCNYKKANVYCKRRRD